MMERKAAGDARLQRCPHSPPCGEVDHGRKPDRLCTVRTIAPDTPILPASDRRMKPAAKSPNKTELRRMLSVSRLG